MTRNKDKFILEKIIEYCDQVAKTIERFGDSYALYCDDFVYQNACAMCILQIGELVGKLSVELIETNADIPWRGIKGTRNIFAHAYGDVDLEIIWNTMHEGIPMLKGRCTQILGGITDF